ncbi:hypothetical protein LCGC14_1113800 [marine sediment metagenome]|uniref:Uncharacterized protein n=1 Tax=marine sediment metagenome TaxID=412755 RepID=A0A0F9M614_9ZZZZ|nr:hypothetical protein [archaeon]
MAYQPLTPIKESRIQGSIIPEAYTPLYKETDEYKELLQTEIANRVGSVDVLSESGRKDIWDNFYLGMRNVLHKTKNYFLNTLPNIVFKDIKEGDAIPFTGEPATKEYAENINERNEKLRNSFKKSYNKSNEKYQEWLDKNPQIQPPKDKPTWNKPAWDAIRDDPSLLVDPGFVLFKMAGSVSFTLGVMGTTLAVGAITGDPVTAVLAGVAVSLPLISEDLYNDLIENGATEEQAATLTQYIAPIIAGVEVAGDMPIINQLGGDIWAKALRKNIQDEVVDRTTSYIVKKGIIKFGIAELSEITEEVVQQAIQDATVKTVNENRKILSDVKNLIAETALSVFPFSSTAGISAIHQETKLAKAEPKPEMKLEEPSVQEISIEPQPKVEIKEEPKIAPTEKPIKELTREEVHDIVVKIIPKDTEKMTPKLIEASLIGELLDRNIPLRQATVIAENVAPDAVAVFKEGEGTESKRLKDFTETLENELTIGISEIKPEVKPIPSKEIIKKKPKISAKEKAILEEKEVLQVANIGTGEFKVGEVYVQEVARGKRPILINKVNPDGSVEGWYLGAPFKEEAQFGIGLASLQPAKWTKPSKELLKAEFSQETLDKFISKVFKVEKKKQLKAPEKPKVKPKGKPAKVAKSIEAKAKEKGIVEAFEKLAEFTPVVIKEQVAKIEKLMEDNIERAKAMAIGEEPLDPDIKGAILVKMIEDYAMENEDGELILALANSPLVSETSIAGQTLRLIGERVPDSATAKIKEVERERKKVAKKKLKGRTAIQEKEQIKKGLKEELKEKTKKISKHSWEALIDELTC